MKTLKLGIAGLGHVGCGLIDLVQRQDSLRLPGRVEVAGVTARNRSRNRPVSTDGYEWFDDAAKLAADDGINVFVELIGGSDGPAKVAVETALKSGKAVITANKALIAMHGQELAELARENGVDLLFEAAVAGGVPVVRVLRDSLAGVDVRRVTGILNGTCNFLTTEMLTTRRPYEVVLAEAQRLGYAESDPTLDVSGMDAAHKAAILAAIAFSADLDFSKVSVRGVDEVELLDLDLADRLGLRIKLITEGKITNDGVVCRVEPMALPVGHPLARVNGSLNTVRVEGEPLGAVTLTGPGAGPGPTASAVMGDVAKLFNPIARPAFGRADHHDVRAFVYAESDEKSAFFLRVRLADRAGALAELTEALAESGVSVDKLLQDSADENGAAPVAIVTHVCARSEIEQARERLRALDSNIGQPQIMAIEASTD
ncbi:homoserine dehydrogenase [Henriciella pelagia]|uniref:Homoserine dehydrogenase n=1 Tax=Henriciella pelagia TaxID=1977912 RepID=A0ABQ1J4Y5_9PROT|nr:homoserine dehydrogenase [Henriciella pelagia]GGB60070.1 homoserine dehydrogenase [Henriciella pelagia]